MAFDPLTPWRLLAVLALVLLNGFFVASEFAIVKVRRTQLAARVQRGDARAKIATHVVDHLDSYLSATQLGITLASLGLGWIGEPFVATLIHDPLALLGIVDEGTIEIVAFTLAFFLITLLHIVLGELAPKSLAIQRAEGVALWTAPPLRLFYLVFKPFIWALNGLANAILRLAGIHPAREGERAETEEELRILMTEAGRRKALTRGRADLILRTFDIKNLQAKNVMTPRPRMVYLDANKSFEESFAVAEESGYSRFPVVENDADHVLGMVHYRDLVKLARADRPKKDLKAILRPVLFFTDTKPVEDVLAELLGRGVHLAIVNDEFGSTDGLLTLEDVLEELFGEIRDEFDTTEADAQSRDLGGGHFVFAGDLPLHQARQLLGIELTTHEVATIGGYVIAELGRLPQKGERLQLGAYEVTIRDIDRRRIQSLDLFKREAKSEPLPEPS